MRGRDSILLEKLYLEEVDYRGEHTAPDKESGAPLFDLTKVYPQDVYSPNAAKYYGDMGGDPKDVAIFSFVNGYRNRPNQAVKIYRAIPDFNKKDEKELKELVNLMGHHVKFNFFPIGNPIIRELRDKYSQENLDYDVKEKMVISDIENKIEEIRNKLESSKPKINSGDWVTIDRNYAIEHGESALNGDYKILFKTVKAKDIYTAGDSIFEWGYDPQ